MPSLGALHLRDKCKSTMTCQSAQITKLICRLVFLFSRRSALSLKHLVAKYAYIFKHTFLSFPESALRPVLSVDVQKKIPDLAALNVLKTCWESFHFIMQLCW